MNTNEMRTERITWLHFEVAEIIERCERGELDKRQLAETISQVVSQEEVDRLDDELLRHAYWATQNYLRLPACWAPTPAEMAYLRRCLRDEDLFEPNQVEFSI